MSIASESGKGLCEFIAGLDLLQLERLITDGSRPEIGFEIISHLEACPSEGCVTMGEAWHEKQGNELKQHWDSLSEEEKQRLVLDAEADSHQRAEDRRLGLDPIVAVIKRKTYR